MDGISVQPWVDMVVRDQGGYIIHSFQMNGNDCQWGGENLRPVFLRSGGGQKSKWLVDM